MSTPIRLSSGGVLSPIHCSRANGVHADIDIPNGDRIHVGYVGQTTLDMFRIGGKPNYGTYGNVSARGLGTLKG